MWGDPLPSLRATVFLPLIGVNSKPLPLDGDFYFVILKQRRHCSNTSSSYELNEVAEKLGEKTLEEFAG